MVLICEFEQVKIFFSAHAVYMIEYLFLWFFVFLCDSFALSYCKKKEQFADQTPV